MEGIFMEEQRSSDARAGISVAVCEPNENLRDELAAMIAKGVSEINNIEQIDRGYEDIDGRLNALGAKITRK